MVLAGPCHLTQTNASTVVSLGRGGAGRPAATYDGPAKIVSYGGGARGVCWPAAVAGACAQPAGGAVARGGGPARPGHPRPYRVGAAQPAGARLRGADAQE